MSRIIFGLDTPFYKLKLRVHHLNNMDHVRPVGVPQTVMVRSSVKYSISSLRTVGLPTSRVLPGTRYPVCCILHSFHASLGFLFPQIHLELIGSPIFLQKVYLGSTK